MDGSNCMTHVDSFGYLWLEVDLYPKVMEEIATVPAAPPSKLSKKLIELQIPTTQIIVITESKMADPVGLPTLSVKIKMPAVNMPAAL